MEFSGESPTVDLTYSDVFLVPRRSAVTSRLQVDLTPQDGTPATLPVIVGMLGGLVGAALGVAVVTIVSAVSEWTPILDTAP